MARIQKLQAQVAEAEGAGSLSSSAACVFPGSIDVAVVGCLQVSGMLLRALVNMLLALWAPV